MVDNMHKFVNGIQIQLSTEEVEKVKAEQARYEKARVDEEAKEAAKKACCASLKKKLMALGFTEEEIEQFKL